MRVLILLMALLGFLSADSFAQSKADKTDTPAEKKTAVELAPTITHSSKELRKAEKVSSNSGEGVEKLEAKIEELENHITKASENPEYNADATNARLRQLREELARLKKQPK